MTPRSLRARTSIKRRVPQSRQKTRGFRFKSKGRGLAADDDGGVRRIDGFGHVSRAVDDLAILAMALELGDRSGGNFDFDCAAAAGCSRCFGHGLVSSLAGAALAPFGRLVMMVTQPPRIGACDYRVDSRDNPRIKSGDGHDGGMS